MLPEAHPITILPPPDPEPDYRRPLAVAEIVCLTRLHTSYPRCPRCLTSLDREYMAFCDRCGQCLDWTHLNRAFVRLIY